MNESDRSCIVDGLIKRISNAADREYQNRVWIKGAGPECDDYDDFINEFLHISEVVLDDYKNFYINENQCELLANFRRAVDDFSFSEDDIWPQRFLRSLGWKRIMELAKEVLKGFGKEPPVLIRDKEKIMENFLKNIAHAADEEYQERVWVKEIGSERGNFYEFLNEFYYEGDDILENYKDFGVTDRQRNLLESLFIEIDSFYAPFPCEHHSSVFLQTIEWKRVVIKAKEVLQAFNYQSS